MPLHRRTLATSIATSIAGVLAIASPSAGLAVTSTASAAGNDTIDVVEAHVDKARYLPGQSAQVTAVLTDEQDWNGEARFTLSHLGETIATGAVPASVSAHRSTTVTWNLTPPTQDFTGYLVEVSAGGDSTSTAIDVSSDWTVYPRMGYLHDYGPEVTGEDRERVLGELAEMYHLNALQFYDWMWRHEKPIQRDADGSLVDTWTAWNGDVISPRTVKDYIADANEKNIAALPYSMSYAALEGFEQHGVDPDWRLQYADSGADWKFQMIQDRPDTVLHIMNPANAGWQTHITDQYLDQIGEMGFDGTHLDQLGNWGKSAPGGEVDGGMQDVGGYRVDLPGAFADLADATRTRAAGTKGPVVGFNAVDGFAGDALAASDTDYLYTELWENHETYAQVQAYLDRQRRLSGGKPAVVAAYLNNHSNTGPRHEAEDATLGGQAAVDNNHAGYTGSGFVDQFGQTGDSVTFTITAPESRRYGLVGRYTNGTGALATRTVTVDGVQAGNWTMQSGAGWGHWKHDAAVTTYLEEGQHTVRISVEPGDQGYINLDSLTLGTFDTTSVRLANAALAASGATHIEMGQDNQMLAAPYFLDHSKQMSRELEDWQKTYYDVITAYENVLFGPDLTSRNNQVTVRGVPTSTTGQADTVWTSVKSTDTHDVIHLVNLLGNSGTWREGPKHDIPTLRNLPVRYYLSKGAAPTSVHVASPDRDHGASTALRFTRGADRRGQYVEFTVPELQAWDFVYLTRAGATPTPLR